MKIMNFYITFILFLEFFIPVSCFSDQVEINYIDSNYSEETISKDTDYLTEKYPLNKFISDGEFLFILLWKNIENRWGGNANSELAYTKLGKNEWTKKNILGKAYFFKINEQSGICSIEGKESNKWIIRFYDLKGNLLSIIEHLHKKYVGDCTYDIPFPIIFSDESIILYSFTGCDTFPLISLPFRIISGGHGSYSTGFNQIEVIHSANSLTTKQKKLNYFEIYDYPYSIFLLEANFGEKDLNKKYTISKSFLNNTEITKFKWETTNANFYPNEKGLIYVSDSIYLTSDMILFNQLAPLPPFPNCKYCNTEVVDYFSDLHHSSDIAIDDSQNIFYAFYEYTMVGSNGIYVYFYNKNRELWKINHLNLKFDDINSIRIYVWNNLLYIGIWGPNHDFNVFMIDKDILS